MFKLLLENKENDKPHPSHKMQKNATHKYIYIK